MARSRASDAPSLVRPVTSTGPAIYGAMKTMTRMIWMPCLLLAACGSEDRKNAPPPSPRPASAPAPAPVPIDPTTFVAVDLSSIPVLADATVKAPPGATVTADRRLPGEDASVGAVIAAGDFALHLWRGTTGGERTIRPMRSSSYVETTSTPELIVYTLGPDAFGFFRPIPAFDNLGAGIGEGDQLLCGPAHEVATADALAPYQAACDSVARK
jgi:hypothetical protein